MSSLSRILAGRKKESLVWDYFTYMEQEGKVKCKVVIVKTNSECGALLAGKNSTNMLSHLRRLHKLEYEQYVKATEARSSKTKPKKTTVCKNATQTLAYYVQRKIVSWSTESQEYQQRLSSVMDMLIDTCYPVTVVDKPSFRHMIKTLDPKFLLPASSTMNKKFTEQFTLKSVSIRALLDRARWITICLDGWSKPGLSSSYVGISACFFDPETSTPIHAFLNLTEIEHPHTGERLTACLASSLTLWNIAPEKVLLVICDNGANIVKAVTILQKKHQEQNDNQVSESDVEDEEVETSNTSESSDGDDGHAPENINEEDKLDLPEHVPLRRLACLAHNLQLIIKPVYSHYDVLLAKTRNLVSRIRKSGAATEKLIKICGKTVISDCVTRWSSTYTMIKRLITIKNAVNEILTGLGIDSLLPSEWLRLEEVVTLLEPFAVQTDILQSDTQSLSTIIPSLVNLECHLEQSPAPKILTCKLLRDFRSRFEFIFNPECISFNPLPAAACLLDPSLADVLFSPDLSPLLNAAKMIIYTLIGSESSSSSSEIPLEPGLSSPSPALQRFKFLATRLVENATTSSPSQDTVQCQLNRYITDTTDRNTCTTTTDSLVFWHNRKATYSKLSKIAEDLLTAPASQAYVERIFSLCGMLTTRRRNRMQKSLEMRVFLKLNKNIAQL